MSKVKQKEVEEAKPTKQDAISTVNELLKADRDACMAKIKAACDEHHCDPVMEVTFNSVTGPRFNFDVVNRREG